MFPSSLLTFFDAIIVATDRDMYLGDDITTKLMSGLHHNLLAIFPFILFLILNQNLLLSEVADHQFCVLQFLARLLAGNGATRLIIPINYTDSQAGALLPTNSI